MGKKIVTNLTLEKEVADEIAFEKFLYNAFATYNQFPLVIRGKKAIARYRLNGAGQVCVGGYGPELQSVIVLQDPHTFVVSTEYGFRHSGSKGGHGKIGHQQLLTSLRFYDHDVKDATVISIQGGIPAPAPAPVVQAAPQQKSIAEQIKEMKELLDAGAITQEEYEQFKKKLLNQ